MADLHLYLSHPPLSVNSCEGRTLMCIKIIPVFLSYPFFAVCVFSIVFHHFNSSFFSTLPNKVQLCFLTSESHSLILKNLKKYIILDFYSALRYSGKIPKI